MKIKYFTPLWGYDHLDFKAFSQKVVNAGFDGIELNLASEADSASAQLDIIMQNGLEYVAQHSTTRHHNFDAHKKHYRQNLERVIIYKPKLMNCHTGLDFFTYEQNLQLIDIALEISQSSGIPIIHETHRGRFSSHGLLTKRYLEARPELRLTADFSHWCCVSESLLEGQDQFVDAAIERADHIHARVGHDQGPQINDPRAPENEHFVGRFLGWWDRIVERHKAEGSEQLTITCEFGPWPYIQRLPLTQQPIGNQWDINIYMLNLLKERYR